MDQKDRSIVTQVAAKIAGELTPHALDNGPTSPEEVGNVFTRVFAVVLDAVFDGIAETESKHGGTVVARPQQSVLEAGKKVPQQVADAFPGTVVDEVGSVRIAGRSHGDIPSWLIAACQKNGTTAVFDNRDKVLGADGEPLNKRPWFVDADNRDLAYWPPKGR
jgi:hypothetical protein